MATIITTIKFRRGTAAQWAASNPTLLVGEPGYETNTKKFKIGDGVTAWNSITDYYELGGNTSNGNDGEDAYVYIGYATDASGSGFATTPSASRNFIAFKSTNTPLSPLTAADFTGLWKNYKGDTGATGSTGPQGLQGATGAQGPAGAAGASAYVYIAYASSDTGAGFTTTFNPSLDYIAFRNTTSPITSPSASDFSGLWKKYKGADGLGGSLSDDSVGNAHLVNMAPKTYKGRTTNSTGDPEDIPLSTLKTDLGIDSINSTLAAAVPNARTITINGVAQDLTQNRSWTVAGSGGGSLPNPIGGQSDLTALAATATGSPNSVFVANMTANITLTQAVTVPANLIINPNGYYFDFSGGGNLELKGVGFSAETFIGETPVFKNASAEIHAFSSGSLNLTPVSPATPDYAANAFALTGNGWSVGQKLIYLTDGGAAPDGLAIGQTYYVQTAGNSFKIAERPGGAAIDVELGAAGATRHYFSPVTNGIYVDISNNIFIRPYHGLIENQDIKYGTSGTGLGTAPQTGGETALGINYTFSVKRLGEHTFQLKKYQTETLIAVNGAGAGSHTMWWTAAEYITYQSEFNRPLSSGFTDGTRVRYVAETEAIGGLVSGNYYYITSRRSDVSNVYFKLAATQGGSAINLTNAGLGVQYLVGADVEWTGAIVPRQLSTELWDTGDDFNERFNCANAAAVGKATEIVTRPRPMNSVVTHLTNKHKWTMLPGHYLNYFATTGDVAPVRIHPDTIIDFNGATLYESENQVKVLTAYSDFMDMGTVNIYDIRIRPMYVRKYDSSNSTVNIGNVSKAYIENADFEDCTGYCFQFGAHGDFGYRARNVTIHGIRFHNCFQQPLFTPNCDGAVIDKAEWTYTRADALPAVCFDFEPNATTNQWTWNVKLTNSRMDLRAARKNAAVLHGFIGGQGLQTRGMRNIVINRCEFLANPDVTTGLGIEFTGADGIRITNCTITGVPFAAIQLVSCTDWTISDCDFGNLAVTSQGARPGGITNKDAIVVWGCAAGNASNNDFSKGINPDITNKQIREREIQQFIYSASGNTIKFPGMAGAGVSYGGYQGHAIHPYENWLYKIIHLNGADYEVTALDVLDHATRKEIYVTPSISPSISRLTVASGSINTATGVWTTGTHNFVTGSRVMIFAASGQGLPTHAAPPQAEPSYGNYFVIAESSTSVRLAASPDEAAAGTHIAFTTQGSGNYYIMPMIETRFSSNVFTGNNTEEYILEPTGASRIASTATNPQASLKLGTTSRTLTSGDTGAVLIDQAGNVTAAFSGVPRDGDRFTIVNFHSNQIVFKAGGKAKLFNFATDLGLNGQAKLTAPGTVEVLASGGNFYVFRKEGSPVFSAGVANDWTEGLIFDFNPADFSGGLANNDPVAEWVSQVGTMTATQSVSAKQPLFRTPGNGHATQPSVYFDSSDDALDIPAFPGAPSALTLAIIMIPNAQGSYRAFNGGGTHQFFMHTGRYGVTFDTSQYVGTGGPFSAAGAVGLGMYTNSGTQVKCYHNNVDVTDPNVSGVSVVQRVNLGASAASPSQETFNGYLLRALAWDRVLPAAARNQFFADMDALYVIP